MGNMKFRGLDTKDLGLIIQYKPEYTYPTKDVTTEHIPGRNGDLHIDNKSWQNVERSYSIVSVFRPGTDFVQNAEKLVKWLTEESGYFRLEDSYDPDVFRMAAFKQSGGSLPNLYDEATVLNVTFDCKPQRYLKEGEKLITFDSPVAFLENPTGFEALPDLRINGISNPAQDDVLLLTVGTTDDNENFSKVNSIITISNIPNDVTSITLISENQTCYSNQNGNINGSINLNDTQFPSLLPGVDMISVNKYKEQSNLIGSYNSKLDSEKLVCACKYMPYKNQVDSKSKLTVVKSWNLLKQQLQQVYDAEAYSVYCMKKSDEYTFESYNNVLNRKCVSFTFRGNDIQDVPSWLSVNSSNQLVLGNISSLMSGTSYTTAGAYIYLNSGYITYKAVGSVLAENASSIVSLVITLYPAFMANNIPSMGVLYDDIPDWATVVFSYKDNTNTVLEKVSFVTNRSGFFYLPKMGWFGKTQWSKQDSGYELTTLTWDTIFKAFMPGGVSLSKTATFTYNFLPYPYKGTPGSQDYQEYLQYEDIKAPKLDDKGEIVVDGDGNKVMDVVNEVTFTIVPNSDITSVSIKAKYNGNYRTQNTELSDFAHTNSGNEIRSIQATSSFIVYCIKDGESVNYKKGNSDWPDYLDENPVDPTRGDPIILNPLAIDYKVLKRGWYRITYDDAGETKNTPWKLLNADSRIITGEAINTEGGTWPSGFNHKTASENSTISFIEPLTNSDAFPVVNYSYEFEPGKSVPDIAFFDKDGNLYSNNKPALWLKVDVIKGEKDDYSDATLSFKVSNMASTGSLFKWDSRSIWMSKDKISEGHLTDSQRTDDTTVYYLDELPMYSPEELSNKFTAIINQNPTSGDPETVSFKPISNGYYREKDSTSWKWLNSTDIIYTAKNSETVTIYNLSEVSGGSSGITLDIIPRWWSL